MNGINTFIQSQKKMQKKKKKRALKGFRSVVYYDSIDGEANWLKTGAPVLTEDKKRLYKQDIEWFETNSDGRKIWEINSSEFPTYQDKSTLWDINI